MRQTSAPSAVWLDMFLVCLHQLKPNCLYVTLFRKKKKDKESKHRLEQVVTSQNEEEVKTKKAYIDKRTPAQMAFDKMQEKRVSNSSSSSNDWSGFKPKTLFVRVAATVLY